MLNFKKLVLIATKVYGKTLPEMAETTTELISTLPPFLKTAAGRKCWALDMPLIKWFIDYQTVWRLQCNLLMITVNKITSGKLNENFLLIEDFHFPAMIKFSITFRSVYIERTISIRRLSSLETTLLY